MTASTAPTQPPDKCPACGETKVRYNTGKIIQFMCNCIMGVDGSDPCECSRAFSAAIALRAERDAARARLAELQAVLDKYIEVTEFRQNYKGECDFCNTNDGVHFYGCEYQSALDALSALASGAESEMTK